MDHESGEGFGAEESAPNARTTRLHEKAIRERWPIPDAVRVKILNRLCKIVDEDSVHADLPRPGHREVIAASRAIISADKLNLEQAKLDLIVPPDQPPSVVDVVKGMQDAAERYERENATESGEDSGGAGDRDGAGEVPDGPEPVQRDDPGPG